MGDTKATKIGEGLYSARIRCGKGQRPRVRIQARSDAEADKRATMMQDVATMLVAAGKSEYAPLVLQKLGKAIDAADARECVKHAEKLCEGKLPRKVVASRVTVRELAARWTSGDLHRQYPDQIKKKRTADEDARVFDVNINPAIGDTLVSDVTLDDCERVMRELPSHLAPATRRNVGYLISRLLKLAVYPLRLIEATPVPPGFLPHKTQRKALAYLYPDEDRRLLECRNVPLCYRLLWGFLTREGMREGEALALTWGDLDLKRGAVRLDKNKTDDPRAWALDPGTTDALARYRETLGAVEPSDLVFLDPYGRQHSKYGLAALLRSHLEAVGLKKERPELFQTTAERQQIRVHDLRGTFVTVSLANAKTESWISDRTGHRSSEMINRYKRVARSFTELELGPLTPLTFAVPELCPVDGIAAGLAHLTAQGGGPQGGPRNENQRKNRASPTGFEPVLQP